MLRNTFLLIAALALLALAVDATTVRREGESADSSSVTEHPWWYDKVKDTALSGGEWLSHFNAEKAGSATYKVEIPEEGAYTFWVRVNPEQAAMRYRVDDGEWRSVPMDRAQGRQNVAEDGKEDIRWLGWAKVGQLDLTAGKHEIEFRMESEMQNHGAIDVFVLTTEEFNPASAPLAKKEQAEEAGLPADATVVTGQGRWEFRPSEDAFRESALLDLRHLNEKEAGGHGFIRRTEDGRGFLRGDGQPIRFWSVVSGPQERMTGAEMDTHCRWLAKLGVNMIRLHYNVAPLEEGSVMSDVNDEAIDRVHRFVYAAKKSGIYVMLSPYGPHGVPAGWGLPGYAAPEMRSWGALFFHERLQTAYKRWMKALYTRKNPYTGVPLSRDPAVAIAQVTDRDGLLWYGFQEIPQPLLDMLGEQFGEWVAEKHGSVQDAVDAWGGAQLPGDQAWRGKLGFHTALDLLGLLPERDERALDQFRFMVETQREFCRQMLKFYRDELGCRQLIHLTNGPTFSMTADIERMLASAGDAVGTAHTFGGYYQGENWGFQVGAHQMLKNRSILRNPLNVPAVARQTVGHPFLISASHLTQPNLYRAEAPFVKAAYMSLSGVDMAATTGMSAVTWNEDPRVRYWRTETGAGGWSLTKSNSAKPDHVGMFPANALIWRLGLLGRGDVVVHDERSVENMHRLLFPAVREVHQMEPEGDLHRLGGGRGKQVRDVRRLAFLVGPVEVVPDGNPENRRVEDLSARVNVAERTVRSNTSQVEMDWGRGVCRIAAPAAAGVAGFLKEAGGHFELGDVVVDSENEYAAISVVAMDGRPLASSERVLVQVGTTSRLTGWATLPASFQLDEGPYVEDGLEILKLGYPPYQVVNTQARIKVRNSGLTRGTRLDVNGYPAEGVALKEEGDWVSLDLPPDTMYLVLNQGRASERLPSRR